MKTSTDSPSVKILLTFRRQDGTDHVSATPVYLSKEDGKPRNFSNHSFFNDGNGNGNAIYFPDLEIRGHWYQGSRDVGEWIGLDVEYYPYAVSLDVAKKMMKSLAEIEKREAKLTATVGYAKGLGQHIVRFGASIGADGYLIYRNNRNSDYCASEFIQYDAGQFIHYCDEETAKKQAIAA